MRDHLSQPLFRKDKLEPGCFQRFRAHLHTRQARDHTGESAKAGVVPGPIAEGRTLALTTDDVRHARRRLDLPGRASGSLSRMVWSRTHECEYNSHELSNLGWAIR